MHVPPAAHGVKYFMITTPDPPAPAVEVDARPLPPPPPPVFAAPFNPTWANKDVEQFERQTLELALPPLPPLPLPPIPPLYAHDPPPPPPAYQVAIPEIE